MVDRRADLLNRRAVITVSGAAVIGPLVTTAAQPAAGPDHDPGLLDIQEQDEGAAAIATRVPKDTDGSDFTQPAAVRAALGADRAANVVYSRTGVGSAVRSVQDKLNDFSVNGEDFTSLQAAINAVNAAGGGRVLINNGVVKLGATGLTIHGNVVLEGAVGRYGGSATRGTTLTYSGTGAAIFGQNILDSQILNIDIDCSGATGTSVRGIHLSGVWKTTLRNVTIRGVTPAKGYGILYDTVGVPSDFGVQHNYLEQCEVPDGIIRLQGISGSDGVTTTVLNTIRGYQYQVVHSQGVMLNATAEGWATGPGYLFDGIGTNFTMVGCDIEGAGSPGIQISNSATVREIGTIWLGFSGAVRVDGNMGSLRSYGGAFDFIGQLAADVPVNVASYSDANATYARDVLVPDNVTGGSQGGGRVWYRRIGGTEVQEADWRFRASPVKAVAVAATSAQTLFSIPIVNGGGVKVRATIWGVQVAAGSYTNYRECLVLNEGGSLTTNVLTAEVLGVNMSLGFSVSGENLLVTCTPTTVNASTVNASVEIVGAFGAYG
jgi:hypothetical protein